jgi:hypothetical protein
MAPAPKTSTNVLRFAQAEDVGSLENARGRILVWRITPSVYASEVKGHLDTSMAHLIVSLADPCIGRARWLGFIIRSA